MGDDLGLDQKVLVTLIPSFEEKIGNIAELGLTAHSMFRSRHAGSHIPHHGDMIRVSTAAIECKLTADP